MENRKDNVINVEDTVTIPKKTYDRLLKDSDLLACLQGCGVDNWGGYGDAMEMHLNPEEE